MNVHLGLALSIILSAATAPAVAENHTITISPEARIGLQPLLDQTLTGADTLTVKPLDMGSPEGALSQPLPDHCLMSVTVELGGGDPVLRPGKMVCISENHVPLEGQVDAQIEALGTCQDEACSRYIINSETKGRLNLGSELTLSPQPRNEQN